MNHGNKNFVYVRYKSPSILFVVDVFKTTRSLGNFAAILLTYVASSVLHVSISGCMHECYLFN